MIIFTHSWPFLTWTTFLGWLCLILVWVLNQTTKGMLSLSKFLIHEVLLSLSKSLIHKVAIIFISSEKKLSFRSRVFGIFFISQDLSIDVLFFERNKRKQFCWLHEPFLKNIKDALRGFEKANNILSNKKPDKNLFKITSFWSSH